MTEARSSHPGATDAPDALGGLRKLGPAAVPILVNLLSERNWAQRRRVVAELAALGDVAMDALCRVLVEDRADEAKNAAAMDALVASVGDPAARLIELASHPVAAVAADATQILGRRGERSALPALAKLALGQDDNVALAAIEALGRIGGRSAVETLIELVRSGNFFRTFPAIDVLGRSGDPRAVAPLAALSNDSRYALEATRALGRTAERAAVPALAAMLVHPSPLHVRVAASALTDLSDAHEKRYGDDYVIRAAVEQAASPGAFRALVAALNGADDAERGAIATVLGMLRNPDAVSVLASLADSSAEPVAKAALRSLRSLGTAVTPQLVALLRSGDSQRRAAVLPLISSAMAASTEVQACLADPDGQVRALAAEALSRIGAVHAVSSLFEVLRDPNPRVVQAAVAAIQALGSSETEALALAAARSPEPKTRREALRVIRFFGYRAGLPIALSLLDDADERTREAAILSLSLMDDAAATAALIGQAASDDEKRRSIAMRALGQHRKSAVTVEALTRGTADPDPWVRYYACQSLGRIAALEALNGLTGLLNDSAVQVRIAAVEALSHLPSEQAFTALSNAASSGEADVRRAAVLGLGTLEDAHAVPLLLKALDSDDPATRLVAVAALGHYDSSESVAAVGRAANDRDESVRRTALGLLSEMRSRDATLCLIGLLPEYRNLDRVRLALSAASPGRIEGITSALGDADDETAAILSSALVRMRTSEAHAALITAFSSPNVAARKAIAIALGALGSEHALESLRQAARTDPDPEVRRISALAAARV